MTPIEQLSNDHLDELIGVHVTRTLKPIEPRNGEARAYQNLENSAYVSCEWRDSFADHSSNLNHVMPLLERRLEYVKIERCYTETPAYWTIRIPHRGEYQITSDISLPRAICLALLRANGVEYVE